jgi:hypothetical protein
MEVDRALVAIMDFNSSPRRNKKPPAGYNRRHFRHASIYGFGILNVNHPVRNHNSKPSGQPLFSITALITSNKETELL